MYAGYEDVVGKVCIKIDKHDDAVMFYFSDSTRYKMYHEQNCCESVCLEDVCGDLDDLIGHPMLMAEEVDNDQPESDHEVESETWTFVKMATINGSVTFRWYGASNGYYSERPDFCKVEY